MNNENNDPEPNVESEIKEEAKSIPHPLELAAAKLFHKARDTEECVIEYIPFAKQQRLEALAKVEHKFKELIELGKPGSSNIGPTVRALYESVMKLDRVAHSNTEGILRAALFLNLFSGFEAFIGELITALFIKKPELFYKLQTAVSVGDVMKASNLDEFKQRLLSDYIGDIPQKKLR